MIHYEKIGKFEMLNAKKMNETYPDSFEVPSSEELKALKPGDFVKICVPPERFWLQLTEVTPFEFKGKVDSFVIIEDLDVGDEISFPHRFVLDTMTRSEVK